MLLASPFAYVAFAEDETLEEPSVEETDTEDVPMDPAILDWYRQQTEDRYQEIVGIFGDSKLSPPVMENFMHAQQAIVEAGEKSNTQSAAQQYNRAIKQFRNALRLFLKENPEAENLFEESEGEVPDEEAPEDLEEQITEVRSQLIQKFQEQFRERLVSMYQNVDEIIGELSPGDAEKARSALQNAEQKLLRIQERLERGEYDEALDELDETSEDMENELGSLEDNCIAQMLRTMNHLEAKFQKMLEVKRRMDAAGEDTGDIDDLINELRGNINSNKNNIKNKGQDNGGQGQDGKPDDKDNNGKGNNGKGNN